MSFPRLDSLGNQPAGSITLKIEKLEEDEHEEHLEDEQQAVVETLTNEVVYKIDFSLLVW